MSLLQKKKMLALGNFNKTEINVISFFLLRVNLMHSELLDTQMSKCTLNGKNNAARTDQIGAESPQQPVSTDGKKLCALFLKSEINSFHTTEAYLCQIETEKGSPKSVCFLCISQLHTACKTQEIIRTSVQFSFSNHDLSKYTTDVSKKWKITITHLMRDITFSQFDIN